MSYKKAFAQRFKGNNFKIHLWDDKGYETINWKCPGYEKCDPSEATHESLMDGPVKKVYDWDYNNPNIIFNDMTPYQRFLIEKYGTDSTPSTTHKEIFFDIEIEMGGALTQEYIKEAPKPVTSIAWYFKQEDKWLALILDPKSQIQSTIKDNKEIISCESEEVLLMKFIERLRDIDPDILIGWNSDFFDIPYLYSRICRVFDEEIASYLSPINIIQEAYWDRNQEYKIAGLECLDLMNLHKKYSWEDEPSYKLDSIGEKYVGLGKVEFEGNLDDLYKKDIEKYLEYNFRDVEILVELDKKLNYLTLTKLISHKGKHNYSEVYTNTRTQDGAISSFLLDKGIIPPSKDKYSLVKKNYAGGYLFCPKAGIYKYIFDEDLTSLYPSIIITLNLGRETLVGRIINEDDRDNRKGLNNLRSMDPEESLEIETPNKKRNRIKAKELINSIVNNHLSISANGVMFRTDRKSAMSEVLDGWFQERVIFKGKMKEAYKDKDYTKGEEFHLLQYTMKILLNSTYGALAVPSFRYGNVLLAEATTLSGQRIICDSALFVNKHINNLINPLPK